MSTGGNQRDLARAKNAKKNEAQTKAQGAAGKDGNAVSFHNLFSNWMFVDLLESPRTA